MGSTDSFYASHRRGNSYWHLLFEIDVGGPLRWKIHYSDAAERQIRRLDRVVQKRILDFMDSRIAGRADPREVGDALTGPLAGTWRYRVGDYRILCRIEDAIVTVFVISVGHRSSVYDR